MTESKRTAQQIRAYCERLPQLLRDVPEGVGDAAVYHSGVCIGFIDNARADLPCVLDAAVIERDVLKTLVSVACGISKSAATGHPLARWEIMQLDDAIMGAGAVIDETAWLADSSAALAADGEKL